MPPPKIMYFDLFMRAVHHSHVLFHQRNATREQHHLHTGNQPASSQTEVTKKMLYYALVFLVIAIVAALLGFGGAAVAFAGIAKILFVLFLVLFLVSLVMHVGRRV